MAYIILAFFIFVFCLLFVNATTRNAIFLTPIWFIILGIMYLRYKSSKLTLNINIKMTGTIDNVPVILC